MARRAGFLATMSVRSKAPVGASDTPGQQAPYTSGVDMYLSPADRLHTLNNVQQTTSRLHVWCLSKLGFDLSSCCASDQDVFA